MGGLDDISNDRLNRADVSGIRLPFNYNSKNNCSEIHLTRPMPSVQLFSLTCFHVIPLFFMRTTFKVVISMINKKTPEGVYAGSVGLRKNYGYVGWQWKVVECMQQMCAVETEMFC